MQLTWVKLQCLVLGRIDLISVTIPQRFTPVWPQTINCCCICCTVSAAVETTAGMMALCWWSVSSSMLYFQLFFLLRQSFYHLWCCGSSVVTVNERYCCHTTRLTVPLLPPFPLLPQWLLTINQSIYQSINLRLLTVWQNASQQYTK